MKSHAFAPRLAKLCALFCAFFLLFCTIETRAQTTIGATVSDAAGVQDTYYVSNSGNNDTAVKNDANKPFKTAFRAFYRAHHDSIRVGRSAKVFIKNGTYNIGDPDEKAMWPDTDWGVGKDTLFVIEGESKVGVKFNVPGAAFLLFSGKSNVILRKFTLTGTRTASDGGENGLIGLFKGDNDALGATKNVLVEDIAIKDANWIGMFIFRIDNVTVRRCNLNNGVMYPIKTYCRFSKFEDLNLNDNGIVGDSLYGNGGFMFIGQDCEVTRVESSGDKGGYGFRMDHVAKRVTLRDCVFNNNREGGIIFETAEGPVSIINCTANNNGKHGLSIATAHDVTVDGCTFENNGQTGISLFPMDRQDSACPAFCRAGDLDATNWLDTTGMRWNLRTTVKNTTIKSYGDQRIYSCDVSGSWGATYAGWLANEFTGSNNTYIHEKDPMVFSLQKNGNEDVIGDFEAWQNASGSDSNSTFSLLCPTGTGTGLRGSYFNGENFNTAIKTQTDARVNFDWGALAPKNTDGSAMSGLNSNSFSVRWEGQLQAQEAGDYTIFTTTDDGVRLWIGGQLKVDKWIGQAATTYSTTVTLAQGQKIDVKMEYFDGIDNAVAKLEWLKPGLTRRYPIPKSQLYQAGALATGNGDGLKGEYYSGLNFNTLVKTQIDKTVNFDWGNGSPKNLDGTTMSSVGPDNFTVRWLGQVQAIESGLYTFTTTTDDGARLWVDNSQIINKWQDQGATSWSGTWTLTAGQKYPVEFQYYEKGGGAVCKLAWTRPGQTQSTIVPQSQLYSTQPATPPTIQNASFESPSVGAGNQQYRPAGASWVFTGQSGVVANGSGWTPTNAPAGTQIAMLQSTGTVASIAQTLNFTASGNYTLSFGAAQRTSWGGAQALQIKVDGVNVGSVITPSGASFATYSVPLSISAGSRTISFNTVNNSGDNTCFIDAVTLSAN